MGRPTVKIKCKKCKRRIDAIILKKYWKWKCYPIINTWKLNSYQKLLIMNHNNLFWNSRCRTSGKVFTRVR